MSGVDCTPHQVISKLATVLEERGMTLVDLAARTGVTVANLSVLKNGRARAVRFSTLTAICHVLECQPGDLLEVRAPSGAQHEVGATPKAARVQ